MKQEIKYIYLYYGYRKKDVAYLAAKVMLLRFPNTKIVKEFVEILR